MLRYLRLMLQLAMSSKTGWEDIASGADSSQRTLTHGLLPTIAIASLTTFLGAFYELNPTFSGLLINAVITFAKYAITYVVGVAALSFTLPKLTNGNPPQRETIEIFCAYSVGIMTLIRILENLLPIKYAMLEFLPLLVIIVMCLGHKFLNIDEKYYFRFAAVVTISIVLPVFIIGSIVSSAA